MDDTRLYGRMHDSLREFVRLLGAASPRSRAVELAGVSASVTPVTPHRSLMNSVVYETAGDLERALPELEQIYEEAGIQAWTVWVPAHDTATAQRLSQAGHALDAAPIAMSMELDRLTVPRPGDLDLDPEPELEALAALNDRAYELAQPDFATALESLPGMYIHIARVDGEPVSCVGAYDHEGDCCITFVATLPQARGRGLARALVVHALHDARERGCTTTSLQATKVGYPVYRKVGYHDLGPIQMWERRGNLLPVP
jgi:GNAT superfamily N-acetyltransferase